VSRRIELTDDELAVRYDGLSAALVLTRELRVPSSAIRSVSVGLADVPGPFAFRLGLSTGPFGNTRRGRFWAGGRRLFLDVDDPERAVVLELEGHEYARVALNVDDPESFAGQLRAKLNRPGVSRGP
jgi:hypothetical protein